MTIRTRSLLRMAWRIHLLLRPCHASNMDHEDAQLRVQTNNLKDAVDRIVIVHSTQKICPMSKSILGRVFLNDRRYFDWHILEDFFFSLDKVQDIITRISFFVSY